MSLRQYVVVSDGVAMVTNTAGLRADVEDAHYGHDVDPFTRIFTVIPETNTLREVRVTQALGGSEVYDDWISTTYNVTLDGVQIDVFTTRIDGRA
jgi:hypothetical protein